MLIEQKHPPQSWRCEEKSRTLTDAPARFRNHFCLLLLSPDRSSRTRLNRISVSVSEAAFPNQDTTVSSTESTVKCLLTVCSSAEKKTSTTLTRGAPGVSLDC